MSVQSSAMSEQNPNIHQHMSDTSQPMSTMDDCELKCGSCAHCISLLSDHEQVQYFPSNNNFLIDSLVANSLIPSVELKPPR